MTEYDNYNSKSVTVNVQKQITRIQIKPRKEDTQSDKARASTESEGQIRLCPS